jgi:hypothetical protein
VADATWRPLWRMMTKHKDRFLQLPLNKQGTVTHIVTDISPHGEFKKLITHMSRVGRIDFNSPDNFLVGNSAD